MKIGVITAENKIGNDIFSPDDLFYLKLISHSTSVLI